MIEEFDCAACGEHIWYGEFSRSPEMLVELAKVGRQHREMCKARPKEMWEMLADLAREVCAVCKGQKVLLVPVDDGYLHRHCPLCCDFGSAEVNVHEGTRDSQ